MVLPQTQTKKRILKASADNAILRKKINQDESCGAGVIFLMLRFMLGHFVDGKKICSFDFVSAISNLIGRAQPALDFIKSWQSAKTVNRSVLTRNPDTARATATFPEVQRQNMLVFRTLTLLKRPRA